MSRRLSRYKRGRRAVDLSASRFDGERQKTASPPARQPSLLFTAVPSDFFLFFSPLPLFTSLIVRHRAGRYPPSNPCSLFARLCPSWWKGPFLPLSLFPRQKEFLLHPLYEIQRYARTAIFIIIIIEQIGEYPRLRAKRKRIPTYSLSSSSG